MSSSEIKLNQFVLRPYKSGDEIRINKGFNKVFNENRSLDDWKWKFKSKNESRILLALSPENDLVTHYAVLTDKFQFKGKKYTSGHSVDTFSVRISKAINLRLFEKVVMHFFGLYGNSTDVSLMYGFPGTRVLKLGRVKLDYGTPLPVQYWEKEIGPKYLKPTLVHSSSRLIKKRINQLWRRAQKRYPVSIIRDAEWIEKRYVTRPNHNYFFLRTSRFLQYSSLAVYTIKDEDFFLVDLIWDGRQKNDLLTLEKALIEKARKKGAKRMCMWLSGDSEAEAIFSSVGWIIKKEPQELHMVVKSFHSEINRKELLTQFYLTKGCTDLI